MSSRHRPAQNLCNAKSSGGASMAMDLKAVGALGHVRFLTLEICQDT